jgi:hypothetical protein
LPLNLFPTAEPQVLTIDLRRNEESLLSELNDVR